MDDLSSLLSTFVDCFVMLALKSFSGQGKQKIAAKPVCRKHRQRRKDKGF
jgi:hypothetical protein